MVLIFTGNKQLDNELNRRIKDSRIVYYSDYVLEEKDATTLITSVQPSKFNFKEFMFKVREKNIQVILLLENEKVQELSQALVLGIYDVVFDAFDVKEVVQKITNPSSFSDISKYIKRILGIEQ